MVSAPTNPNTNLTLVSLHSVCLCAFMLMRCHYFADGIILFCDRASRRNESDVCSMKHILLTTSIDKHKENDENNHLMKSKQNIYACYHYRNRILFKCDGMTFFCIEY